MSVLKVLFCKYEISATMKKWIIDQMISLITSNSLIFIKLETGNNKQVSSKGISK